VTATVAADYDNDDRADLLLLIGTGLRLMHRGADRRYQDVTSASAGRWRYKCTGFVEKMYICPLFEISGVSRISLNPRRVDEGAGPTRPQLDVRGESAGVIMLKTTRFGRCGR
jgi:hypothetical protein